MHNYDLILLLDGSFVWLTENKVLAVFLFHSSLIFHLKIISFSLYLKAITLHLLPSEAVPDITFNQAGWEASWSYHL